MSTKNTSEIRDTAGQATINHLPSETLAEIFLQLVERGGSPYDLRLVSRQWREIAEHHGQLWRRIKVFTWDTEDFPQLTNEQLCTNTSQLSRAITRARNSKLIITVEFPGLKSQRNTQFHLADGQLEALAQLTSPGIAQRWESFTCTLGRDPLDDTKLGDIPIAANLNLDHLAFVRCGTKPRFARSILAQTDSVKSLSLGVSEETLQYVHKHKGDRFWNSIEKLDAQMGAETSPILRRCSHLRQLVLVGYRHGGFPLPTDLQFPHLESLTMGHGDTENCLMISAPKLQHLKLNFDDYLASQVKVPAEGLSVFPSLRTLDLKINDAKLLHAFKIPQHVQNLTIECVTRNQKALMEMFDGSASMPLPSRLTIISNASGAAYLHVMKKSPQLVGLEISTQGVVGKSFWEGIAGKGKKGATLCEQLEELTFVYVKPNSGKERALDQKDVRNWAVEVAHTRDNIGYPLKKFTWKWTDGSSHVVREGL